MANSSSTASNGGNEAESAGADIQGDLQALREDVARLAREVGEIFTTHGGEAWLKQRPYMTLALAFALGFFFGATRR